MVFEFFLCERRETEREKKRKRERKRERERVDYICREAKGCIQNPM